MALQPWFLKVDQETGIPIITIIGDMTPEKFDEFLATVSETLSDQERDRCLWDLRGVSDLLPTIAIRYFGAPNKRTTICRRTAIVIEKDVHFGLARMLAIGTDQLGNTRHVFRDYEQARTWLSRQIHSRTMSWLGN
jgi:hypothetical protein